MRKPRHLLPEDFEVFSDGDVLALELLVDSGETVEEQIDFLGVTQRDGEIYVDSWLYRPDYCTDMTPITSIVGVRLVKRRAERPPETFAS